MNYSTEMGLGAMMYKPSFTKTGSGIQKLMWGYTGTQTGWKSHKPTFIFPK
jgi:hypothetical protein